MTVLEVEDLNVSYGVIQAVQGVSLRVDEGEVVAVIGSNGAGKTSTLLAILGLIPSQGKVRFMGTNMAGWSSHRIVRAGLTLVPEGRRVIGPLTVEENLEMGAYNRRDGNWRHDIGVMYERFPILRDRRNQLSQSLSGGEQQMLALARALMARPKLMLMDEPSMGLAPLIVRQVFEIIAQLNAEGTTVLLVEQNARGALRVANRAYIIESGRMVGEGIASEMFHNPSIVKAYLS